MSNLDALSHTRQIELSDLEFLKNTLERLQEHQQILETNLQGMMTIFTDVFGLNGVEVFMALKNKLGLTKEQAKKMYYQFHSKKSPGQEPEQDPEKSESPDEKISIIIDYMKETSQKLDKIEDDIAYLKDQVNQIIKKL